ncbi:MAG: DUF4403 family protein [Acidobacteriota bacterium]
MPRPFVPIALVSLFGALRLIAQPSPPPPDAPELSTIVMPIRTSLLPLLPLLEAQVPKSVIKVDGFEMDQQQRFGVQYRVTREPIALNLQGTGVHATAKVHYALQGCRRTVNPITGVVSMFPCLSCGFGETMREAEILLDSHLQWDPQWRLRSTTRARPVDYARRCGVTLFHVDITEWVIAPLVQEQLADVVKTIDHNMPLLTNLRPTAQQVWTALQSPIEIAPRTWLVLEPTDVALEPIRGSGLIAASAIALQARTRVVIGERPAIIPRPLPPLRAGAAAPPGLRVPADIEVPYDEASRILTAQFAKQTYDTGAGPLLIESIRVSPTATGRLGIEAVIDYRGGLLKRYRGSVFLEGVPRFDAATSTLSFADLEYSLDPSRKSLFLRMTDHFAHDAVRTQLRNNAHWSVAPQLAEMRAAIEAGLARPLAPGARLSGHVTSITPTAVTLRSDTLALHVVASGTAAIELVLR